MAMSFRQTMQTPGARRLSSVVLSRAAVASSGLFTVLLTSRLLSTEARGTFATLQAAILIAAVVGCASLWLGISVMLPRRPDSRGLGLLLSLAWPLLLSLVIAGVVVMVGAAHGIANTATLSAFAAVSIVVMIYNNVQGLPVGINRIASYSMAEILRAVVGIATLGVVLAAGQRHPDNIILIWGLTSWGVAVTYLIADSRPYHFVRDNEFLRGVIIRSLRIHPNNIIGLAVLRLDIVVLAALSSQTQVAFYSFAVALSEGVWLIPGAIAVIGLADYSHLTITDALTTARRNLRRTFLAAAVTSIGLVAVGTLIILIFLRPTYHAAILPLVITATGALLYSAIHAVNPWIVVTLDRPGFSSLVAFSTLALNMVLLVVLASHGALGAAIASCIAYAFAGCIYTGLLASHHKAASKR
jgi:O-antigen/teichoic acid export membrane protein